MTSDQANWIVALGRAHELPIILAFDRDQAGETAMWRAWDILRDAGARVVCLSDIPEGRDPADLSDTELATALFPPPVRATLPASEQGSSGICTPASVLR